MKRFIFLFVVLFSMIIGNVYADMEGPNVYSAEMFVSNIDGTMLYDWDLKEVKKIEKDTIVEVEGIFEKDGKTYYSVNVKINDSWDFGYLKKEDLTVKGEVIKTEGFSKNEDIRSVVVYKEGTYLYKGPNKVYDKVSNEEIPVGTKLEYQYTSMIEGNYGGYAEFIHTSYNGMEGWILVDNLAKIINAKVMVDIDNAYLYETPKNNAKQIEIIIPKYTELDIEYVECSGYDFGETKEYYYLLNNGFVFVEYNGQKGWLSNKFYVNPNINNNKIIIVDKNVALNNVNGESRILEKFEELEYTYVGSKYIDKKYEITYYIIENGEINYITNENVINQSDNDVVSLLVKKEEGCIGYNVNDEIVNIPYLTQIEKVLYSKFNDYNDCTYIVEYNEELVKVSSEDFLICDDWYILNFTTDVLNLYESLSENSKVICEIPAYSKIVEKYSFDDENIKYIKYNGKEGFIKTNSEKDIYPILRFESKELESVLQFKIYETNKAIESSYYEDGETVFVNIPKGERIVQVYEFGKEGGQLEEQSYILYQGNVYTILNEDIKEMILLKIVDNEELYELLADNKMDIIELEDFNDSKDITENIEDKININDEKDVEIELEKNTPKKSAIVAIIAACIIAITAGVTMLFINKKINK